MAAEDYFDIGSAPGDEEDNASDCRQCGAPIFLVAHPRRKFVLHDYYSGEPHRCPNWPPVADPADFPLSE